jgi:lysophospholipase L1-like esterase
MRFVSYYSRPGAAARLRALARTVAGLAVASALAALSAQTAQPVPVRRIAIFGSSVASGTGDESGQEGYAGLLRGLLQPRGWEVVNRSRSGDNTKMLMSRFAPDGRSEPGTRYLVPAGAGYVVIALSLGNEGIRAAEGATAKDAIFEQYSRGIRAVIDRSRSLGIVPIVTLCYTRNDFTDIEYRYTRRMNARINEWDVPSVNLLGAVDDGTGKWAKGFWWDSLHPNASGHAELATTFVPSLFDALERGKPLPRRPEGEGFARLSGGAALTFTPDATMHPFALGLTVRTRGDGTVATVTGTALTASTGTKTVTRAGAAAETIASTSLSAGAATASTIGIRRGVWTYTSTSGDVVASSVPADARWHQVLLSHYTARGESLLFIDGVLAGRASERVQPAGFVVGGPAPSRLMDVKDILLYRSALNADEAMLLWKGALLQASLEIYAPLRDPRFVKGTPVENRAQSLSALTLEAGTAAHVTR